MTQRNFNPFMLTALILSLSYTSAFAENLDGKTIRSLFNAQTIQLTETGKKPVDAYLEASGEMKITYATGAKRTYAWLVRDSGEVCVQKRKATCGWLEKAKTANPQVYVWHQDGKPLGEWLLKPKS
jgi:hypothetical protein